MIKLSRRLNNIKSPILIVGLFCLLLLVSACTRTENPDDVAIAFWTALAEHDLEQAKYFSTEDSARLFNEDMRNASIQVGKVKYVCDGATVETWVIRQSAEASSSFKTILIRDQEQDRWKVDYPQTIENISEKRFKSIITTAKETVKVSVWSFIKELGHSIVTLFKNMKDRLLR